METRTLMPTEPTTTHEQLAQLALDLGSARDLPTVYRRLSVFVRSQTPTSGMFVSRYDAKTELRTCVYAFSEGDELDARSFPPMPNTGSPHSRAVVSGETIVTRDFQEAMAGKPRYNVGLDRDPRLPQSSIVVPMKAHGEILGAMEVQSVTPSAFTSDHVSVLQMAAHFAALAASNVEALAREKQLRGELEARATELEAKVRDRVRELAAKNRELEAFSFTVAHDLRAPLRAILNIAQDLVRREAGALGPDARADLEAVHASSVHMAKLVEDLLQFARTAQGAVHRELFDMSEIARTVLAEAARNAPDRKAEFHVQANLIVDADPALVRILLDNLLSNAWKYSARKPETIIDVGARIEGGEVVYFVRDHGVGFDPAQASKLFSAFQRLHPPNEYEGTGIGLATAARIVQRHGGRIWAESTLGEGATFSFTLGPARGKAP